MKNKKLPEGITEKMLEDARNLEAEVSRQMKKWKPKFDITKFKTRSRDGNNK